MHGIGRRHFDVTKFLMVNTLRMKSCFIFPQQLPKPDMASSSISELFKFNYGPSKMNGEPLCLVAASGPYTLDDDLSFSPMHALLETVSENLPDVLILMGPFLDERHPLIASSSIEATFEDIFADRVAQTLIQFAEAHAKTRIVLVPSTYDVFHPFPVFPQAPFKMSDYFSRFKTKANSSALQVSLS